VLEARRYGALVLVVPDEGAIDRAGQNCKAAASILRWPGAVIPCLDARLGTPRFDRAIFNDKIRALAALESGAPALVVATPLGIRERFPRRPELDTSIRLGRAVDRDALIRKWTENGYRRVRFVEQPLEFSVRGGILDVYALGNEWPVRMEFFDDTVDWMKEFAPSTQRTFRNLERLKVIGLPPGERPRDFSSRLPAETPVHYLSFEAFEQAPTRQKRNRILSDLVDPGQAEAFAGTVCESPFRGIDFASWNVLNRIDALMDWLTNRAGRFSRLYVSCATEGEIHRLDQLIRERLPGLSPAPRLLQSELLSGFLDPGQGFALLTDAEIFKRYRTRNLAFRFGKGVLSRPADSFRPGDAVVHFSHGIGMFRGVKNIPAEGGPREVLVIEYADEAKLYVPREQFFLVEKYVGLSAAPPKLDRLHSSRWRRKKKAAFEAIHDYAGKILTVEAERETKTGVPFDVDQVEINDFEHSFRFHETPDQETAIREVKRDLASPHPMNRLILGDAGFGKTEVAARAAFITALSGKQTALLAPTTILAEQHFRTFSERMAEYPVRVEVLSRFTSGSRQKDILKGMQDGRVDIVIGTHRLVQKDVRFKDLGLLVVDEEQRFGVAHKDFLVRRHPLVNILNLSATPIPRTLYLSLMGVRNMSAIMTAPRERRPIETRVLSEDWDMVRTAVRAELSRSGQFFFVHNRIHSIDRVVRRLRSILPETRIEVAHGRLPENELKRIMNEFNSGEIDCLVATNIIESGLDMPNVNTLIVHNAERFGLAELYQLRGRIGRFNRKAYAYFMLTPGRPLDAGMRNRIRAINEFSKPGGGYYVALKDLEIRGAGNILGTEQSGHIAAIGFDLYCKLLSDSVKTLKGEPVTPRYEVHLLLGEPGALPDTYVPDFQDRFQFYKKLASVDDTPEIDRIHEELEDRFGRMPETAVDLLRSFRIKCLARQRGILKIQRHPRAVEFTGANHETSRIRLPAQLRESIYSFVLRKIEKMPGKREPG
jgi:transcription-repair coupling factor (superfamily II helicase)